MAAANLDAELEKALRKSFNLSVPWFLCTSWLYYQKDIGTLSDVRFDKLCHEMLAKWKLVVHPHKHFIKPSMLKAGTGFDLPWRKLPARVYGAAYEMGRQLRELGG